MKIKKIIVIMIILLCIIIGVRFCRNNSKEEIIPTPEIEENEEVKQSLVTLYFIDINKNELVTEGRLIESKELLNNPYEKIVKLLIDKPKNEKLKSAIPEETYLYSAKLENETVILDFSKEFIENHIGSGYEENLTIYSIVNSLCELNEVNYVRILIEGEENKEFKDGEIKFDNDFCLIR